MHVGARVPRNLAEAFAQVATELGLTQAGLLGRVMLAAVHERQTLVALFARSVAPVPSAPSVAHSAHSEQTPAQSSAEGAAVEGERSNERTPVEEDAFVASMLRAATSGMDELARELLGADAVSEDDDGEKEG